MLEHIQDDEVDEKDRYFIGIGEREKIKKITFIR